MRALFFDLGASRILLHMRTNDRKAYYAFSTKKPRVLPLLLPLRTATLKQTIGEEPPIGVARKKIQRGENFGRTQKRIAWRVTSSQQTQCAIREGQPDSNDLANSIEKRCASKFLQ